MVINLWWQQNNSVHLEIIILYVWSVGWFPRKVSHLQDVVWLQLSFAERPCWSNSTCWSWFWICRVNDYLVKNKLNSNGLSRESLSYWIDAVDTERNEIMPNCSSSVAKNLIKWAVIWAGTHYTLIKKSEEQVIGLLCTL